MKKNYFAVPSLSKVQLAIAKDMGFNTVGTIETISAMTYGNQAIHWLVAKWLIDLLQTGEWGSAWTEVFRDIVEDHGYGRPVSDSNGAHEVGDLVLNHVLENNDETLSALLAEIGDVLKSLLNPEVRQATPVTVSMPKLGGGVWDHLRAPVTNVEPLESRVWTAVLQMGEAIAKYQHTGNCATTWQADAARRANISNRIADFSNDLILGNIEVLRDPDSWWSFIAEVICDVGRRGMTGLVIPCELNIDHYRRAIALAVITYMLDLGTTNQPHANSFKILSNGILPKELNVWWEDQLVRDQDNFVNVVYDVCLSIVDVLALYKEKKPADKVRVDTQVQEAKDRTHRLLEAKVAGTVGKLSPKVSLVDLFFRDARNPGRKYWLPIGFESVSDISRVGLVKDAPEGTLVVAEFVKTLQEELNLAGLDGSSFFLAYWLIQAATKKDLNNVMKSFARFIPRQTPSKDRKSQLDVLYNMATNPAALKVFWETAGKFIN